MPRWWRAIACGAAAGGGGAADEDGHGHHLAYSGVAGVDIAATKALTLTAEVMAQHDAETGSSLLGGLSLAGLRGEATQFDAGANIGLRHAADVSLYVGLARRF